MSRIEISADGKNWTKFAGSISTDVHSRQVHLHCALCKQVLPAEITMVCQTRRPNVKGIEVQVTPPKGWYVFEGAIVCSALCEAKYQIELLRTSREALTLQIQRLQKIVTTTEEVSDA